MPKKKIQFKKFTKDELQNLSNRRQPYLDVIAEIRKRGVEIDLTIYPTNAIKILIMAIEDHQQYVKYTEKELAGWEPTKIDDDEEEIQKAPPYDSDDDNEDDVPAVTPPPAPPVKAPVKPPAPPINPKAPVKAVTPKPTVPKPVTDRKMINALALPEESSDEFVRKVFLLELGREPDPQGMQTYTNHIGLGMSRSNVRNAIHNSPEGKKYRSRK